MTNEKRAAMTNDILNLLGGGYRLEDGTPIELGNAVSSVKSELRWTNLGSNADFEHTCRELGFEIVRGKNRRGNKALVITL
jgi:hypothetical protein